MLKIIPGKKIDSEKWEVFIEKAVPLNPYVQSWYLNLVFPGWSVAVMDNEEEIKAAIVFPDKNYLLFHSLVQPFHIQQLGLLSIDSRENYYTNILRYIRKSFAYVAYHFNTEDTGYLKNEIRFQKYLKERITYHLSLHLPYNLIKNNFSENHKRNIKKFGKSGFRVSESNEIQPLIELFRNTKGKELPSIKDQFYELLIKIFIEARNRGQAELLTVLDTENKIVSGGFFLVWKSKIVYLFGVSDETGKKSGGMHAIFDTLIQKYAGENKILDFEGSNIPSVARFFSGFGADPVIYCSFRFSNIPFLDRIRSLFQ